MELGIAVSVAQREGLARHFGLRLAVPHHQHSRRARRRREAVLPYALVGLGILPVFVVRHGARLGGATVRAVKLGSMIGYWGSGPPHGVPEGLAAAEQLGFDSCWTAEAYGSDALTPLAWWGAATERIKLGTSICQISARTPTAMAMAAITLDHLSGGRFILGLGASGPQVVEGWYGDEYPKPLGRTREYVEIIRRVLARKEPVEFAGE